MNTCYHAKYHAHNLTKQTSSNDIGKLSMSLFDAAVDLNPHQVDAALFAFHSPLSKGVLLADEVGLGKTIEAGLVLCQYWAERKRKLLVICPASLRKQWSMEMEEKFNLPTVILDAKSNRDLIKNGIAEPFRQTKVIITSMNFANSKKEILRSLPWDLTVIDEAHKLRNAYRASNRIGQGIRWALAERKKLLLTATPLQNSLLELYGLSTLIDEYLFGDLSSFRTQYCNQDGNLGELRSRMSTFCKRTLRKEVLEYIRYTERRAITAPFQPTTDEQKLYDLLSAFLQREGTYAIPRRQRTLTTLIIRKLLASSSSAVSVTLQTIKQRLEKILAGNAVDEQLVEELLVEADLSDEEAEEIANIETEAGTGEDVQDQADAVAAEALDPAQIRAEIKEIDEYIRLAESISVDTKSHALLNALEIGFQEMLKMGARRKALIFTESRRTQDYLKAFLDANGYSSRIVLFNGTNSDKESTKIFEEWLTQNEKTGRISGSRIADKRIALIEHFRDSADIMIATEAGAEGVNLQFCSLVVNYDLPWNPQRIEQRIGRCHRYGQQHDVVVVNFLNEGNAADCRVFEILRDKFNLFNGVFGASDEVLGSIESGVDFERRILAIYQECRSTAEIESAFRQLQREMEDSILSRLDDTRRLLMENFDQDVHDRLKISLGEAQAQMNEWGRNFWGVTKVVLGERARFDDSNMCFDLVQPPLPAIGTGRYQMISKNRTVEDSPFVYRLSHPLGDYVLDTAKSALTPLAALDFNISDHPAKISLVEALRGKSGWLTLRKMTVDAFERDEYLLFTAIADDGTDVDAETCAKMFQCAANTRIIPECWKTEDHRLAAEAMRRSEATVSHALETSTRFFRDERDRLSKWADDLVVAAEKDLRDTKVRIKNLQRQSRIATTLAEQHDIEMKLQEQQKLQRKQRQHIFDVEDEILARRDGLIKELESRLQQKVSEETLFTIRWQVI